jgi:sulfite reductase (NADPH) flavoprotein alpha-component
MTGNSETLAMSATNHALNEGWNATLRNLSECTPNDLGGSGDGSGAENAERYALFVVSTWGDGEPPDDALPFFNELESDSAPNLAGLRYAVLGLGDSSYEQYNACARKLDERLAVLGGQRVHERIEADLDYEDTFNEWVRRVFPLLDGLRKAHGGASAP